MIEMAQFTTAEVASKFGTTPRTLRKFLRSNARSTGTADSLPGKGSRYALEGKALKGLQSQFAKWEAAEKAKRAELAQRDADAAQAIADSTDDSNA